MTAAWSKARAWLSAATPVAVAVFATLGILQTVFLGGQMMLRDRGWRAEAQRTASRVQVLTRRDANLSERQRRAATDPAYVGSLARRLGFVSQIERVIVPLNPEVHPGADQAGEPSARPGGGR